MDQTDSVYKAENYIRFLADEARKQDNGLVSAQILGSTFNIPMDRTFGDIESVRRYANIVIQRMSHKYPRMAGVKISQQARMKAKSYYRPSTHEIVLAGNVGADLNRWAMRELVVLHELAHAAAPVGESHGAKFTAIFSELLEEMLDNNMGIIARMAYHEAGAV